jgi:hypothetical protein
MVFGKSDVCMRCCAPVVCAHTLTARVQIDYTRAQLLTWGRHQGCAFVTQRCDAWVPVGYAPCPDAASWGFCTYDAVVS